MRRRAALIVIIRYNRNVHPRANVSQRRLIKRSETRQTRQYRDCSYGSEKYISNSCKIRNGYFPTYHAAPLTYYAIDHSRAMSCSLFPPSFFFFFFLINLLRAMQHPLKKTSSSVTVRTDTPHICMYILARWNICSTISIFENSDK